MQIVKLMCGLGNQLLQYVFARHIELTTGEKVVFDDSWFFLVNKDKIHNGLLEMKNIFPIELSLMSEKDSLFDGEKSIPIDWESMIEKCQKGNPFHS